jgi:GTP pyrophosphokinase
MTKVGEIFKLIKYPLKKKNEDLIIKACNFAEKAHKGHVRQSGDPYFVHVFETGKNLARLGMDPVTISAGLLHDTLEDTPTNEEEFKKEFGPDIYFLVTGVTKLGRLKYRGRERHVESLRKFFIAAAQDVRVLIIKLADRLHNISTLGHLREDKRKRIALETIEIYAPLANRLGMGKLKGELEDHAFPYVYPKEYEMVEKLLKERANLNQKYLEDIYKQLTKELKAQNVKVVQTDYRVKHKYSLYKKLIRYQKDIEKIYDIIALRVIVSTIEDCYRALGIVHSIWKPLPNRIKDYIALPKPNGYQSLHTTIITDKGVVEIQIRTEEMHEEAEYGIAAHFAYKEKMPAEGDKVAGKFAWIKDLKDIQKIVASPDKFLEHLKMDFFRDRIFIFTPQGDVVDLPEESSPIDFAYAIHSDIGNHCSGAKINGKMSSLNTKLKNGDIVEITIKEESHPTSKWLDYTKTALARKHIRSYLDQHGGGLIQKYLFRSK